MPRIKILGAAASLVALAGLTPQAFGQAPIVKDARYPDVVIQDSESPVIEHELSGCEVYAGDCHACDACDSCSCYLFGPDEAWQLFPEDPCRIWNAGGWLQLGYHTGGANANGTGLFNNYPNRVQLQQAWAFLEKPLDTESCCWDWGFRIDYVYGTDGQDTQAFGGPPRSWDNQWDNGGFYGHAIPQLYFEVGNDILKVKAGHFFTIIGYEVVPAPDNFFYSHARTMVLNEPFTHSGILAEYAHNEYITIYGGWTQGWDTGFSRNSGGSFLGGISFEMTDDMTLTWALVAGDFGFGVNGSDNNAYMHSIVFDWQVTDKIEYVFHHDFQDNQNGIGGTGHSVAINQYLFYTFNDCWKAGIRGEWFNQGGADTGQLTMGLNYRPHANIVIRPEVRWDFFDAPGLSDSATFGMDMILTW